MPGAIVIGASSGIGAALARRLSEQGYRVGLAARRVELLEQVRAQLFWVATPEKAAEQIFAAIRGRKRHAYVTRRWRLVAWLLRGLPAAWYQRM